MDFDSKKFKQAYIKGYMYGCESEGWKHTFIGAFLIKYPNRTRVLDIMKSVIGHNPKWEDISDKVLRDVKELITEKMSANSAKTTLYRIKSVLNEFDGETNMPSEKYKKILRSKGEPTINVFLNEDEVELIERCPTFNKTEEYVKCSMMISFYTGCRHSDAMKATIENIQHGNFSYVPEKTKNLVVSMPAHRNLAKYLIFHDDFTVSAMTLNDTMRKLCKRMGITSQVKVYRGGEEITGEKWEFVSSHTCRRSFATNLALRHCDIYTISRLMGHTNVAQTEKYICCNPNVSDEALMFFK